MLISGKEFGRSLRYHAAAPWLPVPTKIKLGNQ